MGAPSATCSQHNTRDAVGICVRCRTPLCTECITKLDGINHCRRCLEALAKNTGATAVYTHSDASAVWTLGFSFALLALLTWFTLEVLLPGRGAW